MMIPEYKYGDLLIKRVSNGWVVVTGSHHDEEATIIAVHEDTESEHGMKESLYHMLVEVFEVYMQSKRTSGLKISFSEKTREQEDEEKD
jgi:hypothetical protein